MTRKALALLIVFIIPLFSLLLIHPSRAWAEGPGAYVTHNDNIPNFAENPTIRSAANGNWSNPATWTPARLPNASDIVLVRHRVTYETLTGEADVVGIYTDPTDPTYTGILQFRTDINTRLKVVTLLVMPGGELRVGTAQNPVAPNVSAEIVIDGQGPFTGTVVNGVYTPPPGGRKADPRGLGTGLIAVDGIVSMHGAPRNPTFLRVTRELSAGDTVIALSQPATGWLPGDRLLFHDTRIYPVSVVDGPDAPPDSEEEVIPIAAMSPDGRTVTLARPLAFPHKGVPSTLESFEVTEYFPYVFNLGRNVIISSVSPRSVRGHTLFTHRSAVDIQYVAFRNLGRTTVHPLDSTTFDSQGVPTHIGTNQIGRYPLHLHHLLGPDPPLPGSQYQYQVVGNAIFDDAYNHNHHKWGLTIHNTHYGLTRDNVVFNVSGSGVTTEDGSESRNVIDHNAVVRVPTPNIAGAQGYAIGMAGHNNYVTRNFASRSHTGLSIGIGGEPIVKIPKYRGADPSVPGEFLTMDKDDTPLLEYRGNEVWGGNVGFSPWFVGLTNDPPGFVGERGFPNIVSDLLVLNPYDHAFFNYSTDELEIRNMKVIYDRRNGQLRPGGAPALFFSDYQAAGLVFDGLIVRGAHTGVVFGPTTINSGNDPTRYRTVFRNCTFQCVKNLVATPVWSAAVGEHDAQEMVDRTHILSNVRFLPIPPYIVDPEPVVDVEMFSDGGGVHQKSDCGRHIRVRWLQRSSWR